jgi:hypothetical protein
MTVIALPSASPTAAPEALYLDGVRVVEVEQ